METPGLAVPPEVFHTHLITPTLFFRRAGLNVHFLFGGSRGRTQPLLDLIVAYRARLLHDRTAQRKNDEIKYATHGILSTYLMAIGFVGDPTARVIGNGGAQKKNSYTWSCAQSTARSFT